MTFPNALLFLPAHSPLRPSLSSRPRVCRSRPSVRCILSPSQQTALIAVSIPTLPVLIYSELTLLRTGCGLPPGPYGLLGALEGISYLILAAILLLSLYSKFTTGKGLPSGPANLLGAIEGLVYLLVLGGVAIAAYVAYTYGELPAAVPAQGSRCFPTE